MRPPRQKVKPLGLLLNGGRLPAEYQIDEAVFGDNGLIVGKARGDVGELDALNIKRPVTHHLLC
jgi:hypothetical protein